MLLPESFFSTEDQEAFLLFIRELSNSDLETTYSSYHFLAGFKRAEDIWKRDACREELVNRGLPIPDVDHWGTPGLPTLFKPKEYA